MGKVILIDEFNAVREKAEEFLLVVKTELRAERRK